jgi:hypothetical protein
MRVDTSGNLQVAGDVTAVYSFSDIRLKENLKPLNNVLSKLNSIDTYKFNYKSIPDKTSIGVIAQELIKEFPELVYETTPIDQSIELENIYAVRYELLSVVALQAIKELNK